MALLNVSAIIVTRGDVDLTPITDSFGVPECSPIKETIIWDNSERKDLAVYGRYAAIAEAKHDLILVQDDDCVLPPESIKKLIAEWQTVVNFNIDRYPGMFYDRHVVANMPQSFRHDFYSDHCLVGFGAVFHRDLPAKAFQRFLDADWVNAVTLLGSEPFLSRTCDIVFTGLTPRVLVDVPYENLPWATNASRMYRDSNHIVERTRMLELVRQVRDA